MAGGSGNSHVGQNFKVILEVYVRDNGSFKRIAKLVPEVTPAQFGVLVIKMGSTLSP